MVEVILAVLVFFPFAAGLIVYALGVRGRKQPVGDGSSRGSKRGLNQAAQIVAFCSVVMEFLLVAYLAVLFYERSRIM